MMITRISLSEIKDHDWVTMYGLNPLLKEEENCQLIEVRIFKKGTKRELIGVSLERLIEVSLKRLIEVRQNFRKAHIGLPSHRDTENLNNYF